MCWEMEFVSELGWFSSYFCSNLQVRNGKRVYTDFKGLTSFWKNCSEDDLILKCGRVDPLLCLHVGCSVMLTNNICVAKGLANGSQAVVKKNILKPGAEVSTVYIDSNIPIQGVLACDVDHICLRHTNKWLQPQDFIVSPKEFRFQASIPKPSVLQCKGSPKRERIHMKGMQLPIVVNHATTGHKLQGSGVNNILVNS